MGCVSENVCCHAAVIPRDCPCVTHKRKCIQQLTHDICRGGTTQILDDTENNDNNVSIKGRSVVLTKLSSVTMTSSNGNIFCFTGPLCAEFTGHRWIPRTKACHRALMFSLIWAWTNGWVNNRDAGNLRRHRAHYDLTLMVDKDNGDAVCVQVCVQVLNEQLH